MRIVIDLQGAQGGSRNRGIGRYSMQLALAMARNRGGHDVVIALSDLFPDSIGEIRAAFRDVLSPEAIRVWASPPISNRLQEPRSRGRVAAELIREAFLASLSPDVVVVTSLFEGLSENVLSSVGQLARVPTAVVLYDLIPLIHRGIYLENATVREWYAEKLDHLCRADHLLAISASSAAEARSELGWSAGRVSNIGAAANPSFQPLALSEESRHALLQRYALRPDYFMYTGGIDYRKNIERLIRSYGRLPAALRERHQLVVVCHADQHARQRLREEAAAAGLPEWQVVLTGYVPDDDLLRLYNLCIAFVFPSLHEGFGLPALEAMQCGKAVIAANTSSLPEVIGLEEALFDPTDEASMAAKMEQVLTDSAFRRRLETHGPLRAREFSWDRTAQTAIRALEKAFAPQSSPLPALPRPRLAFVSPIPPDRSGVAYYGATLLPELATHYEIELVVGEPEPDIRWKSLLPVRTLHWFRENAGRFDRIIYQFGNSSFHAHMFDLLERFPGVVVLHDFFLSGIQYHLGRDAWSKAVLLSHGIEGLIELDRLSPDAAIRVFPANLPVLQNATGIIVHSEWARDLALQWYGEGASAEWKVIPHARASAKPGDELRAEARRALGFDEGDIVVCTFGHVAATKLSCELIEAFADVAEQAGSRLRLVIAGQADGPYGERVMSLLRDLRLGGRAEITGWLDEQSYDRYLHAADIAVQLRAMSRGESSGAVLDCMGRGLAVIANANGAMAELDPTAVVLLPDRFARQELSQAIAALAKDADRRIELGTAARAVVETLHDPGRCAELYRHAIEAFSAPMRRAVRDLPTRLALLGPTADERQAWAEALAFDFPAEPRPRCLFIDVTGMTRAGSASPIQDAMRSILVEMLSQGRRLRTVPVRRLADGQYVTASGFIQMLMNISAALPDEAIDYAPGDVFLILDPGQTEDDPSAAYLRQARTRGARVHYLIQDMVPLRSPELFPPAAQDSFGDWLRLATSFDGVLCTSPSAADELRAWVATAFDGPAGPKVNWFHPGVRGAASNAVPDRARAAGGAESGAMPTPQVRESAAQLLAALDLEPALLIGQAKPQDVPA